jgi:NAD(P)-dependent dehydrogenase (short-subunit alcohol dehydrogenase family)
VELAGKVAIVTGASRGIGRQVALALAARQVKVVVAARTAEPRRSLPGTIGQTVADIREQGGEAVAVRTDVTVADDLAALVAAAVEQYGRLDILINNAADTGGESVPIDVHTREGWVKQFDTNVHAPFTLMSRAVPHMKRQGGGVIINVTSSAGDLVEHDFSQPHESVIDLGSLLGYSATKAALNRLSNALAPELFGANIAVVCLEPGFTRTERMTLLEDRGLVDAQASHSPDEPVARVLEILTAPNPLAFTGTIVRTSPETSPAL